MNCTLVTVDALSMSEAAALMRDLGYRKTSDLRLKAVGMTVDNILDDGLRPSLCRFKRSGKVIANAYYWTEEQELEIGILSVKWIENQLRVFEEQLRLHRVRNQS